MTRQPLSAIIGFVQAGGRSARMGEDKAWLEIERRPMIERVLAAAQPVVAQLAIVINAPNPQTARYAQLAEKWQARLLHDLHAQRGPLGGIHTALAHCQEGESALVLACDLPFITAELLALLCHIHQTGTHAIQPHPPLVTVPLDQAGRWQPLCAVYDKACQPQIEEMLAANELKVDRLYARVATQRISFAEFAQAPNAERFFVNINTLTDYQQAIVRPPSS